MYLELSSASNKAMMYIQLLSSVFCGGNWDSERLSNSSMITQKESGDADLWQDLYDYKTHSFNHLIVWVSSFWSSCFFFLN